MHSRTEYESRLSARQQTHEQLRRRDDHAASFRAAVFCAGLLLAWVVLGGWGVPAAFLLIPVALFVAAVVYHEAVKRQLRANKRAIQYYERCLQRLDGEWASVGPDGEEFADPLHHYSGDLDIFGEGSLFQLLNSPVTPVGANTLARWLAPEARQELPSQASTIARQQAVTALRDQIDRREQLAIIGPTKQSQSDAQQLQQWLSNPGRLTATWIKAVGSVLGVVGVLALGYFLLSMAAGTLFTSGALSLLILVAVVDSIFLYQLREPLGNIKRHSERAVFELRRIVKVVTELEQVEATAPAIARLRDELIAGDVPASAAIRSLQRTVSQFDNMQRNLFTAPFAFISMAILLFACVIDRWRTTHGSQVESWFRAVGELEALLAFSQLHFENPDYCFPKLIDEGQEFVGKGVAHPLLSGDAAVANDVALNDECRLLLVSGSNMSGKSTLLRSVGINTVLAWAGAPVYASQLTVSPLRVAAAMRVQDSLQTGTSHFFAELKRIQLVVKLAEQDFSAEGSVLFLLDEILHGTNSHDRLVGARGVITSLVKSGAIGLVTTHDLALSEIVNELDSPAENIHFRDEWVDGKMTFDYRIREGVVPKSNALSLMRLLGLDV